MNVELETDLVDQDRYGKITSPNQPPPLRDYDSFGSNRPLVEAVKREGASWAEQEIAEFGRETTGAPIDWAFQANENPPQLKTFDRYGNRIDEVDFHPSWHRLMEFGTSNGIHSMPWTSEQPASQVARAAKYMLYAQTEQGTCCPLTMTFAAVPALRATPTAYDVWTPRLTADSYDPELKPIQEKTSALMGMAMTEKQGGSDVRANLTTATPIAGEESAYWLNGHKWFCSAPMSDGFLVLAQAAEGVTCFLVPRMLEDGTRNRFQIQRLKDKLGNKSNASSEIEFDQTWGQLIGEPGRGVPTIIEMVNHTRLDCVLGSTAVVREAIAQATHHAAHRSAFGKLLIDQPLMQNVLADLCLESEAATQTAIRLARAYDLSAEDRDEDAFRRIGNAVSKYWICKRSIGAVAEAVEVHGGAGYVEESNMPRLYREIPLNSIWEGSGNVNCLDVMRAMIKSPASVDAFIAEVELASGNNNDFDVHLDYVKSELADPTDFEPRARKTVELMALALQGSLMVRYADPVSADAFCASRLGGDTGFAYGTLNPTTDFKAIIERHQPLVG